MEENKKIKDKKKKNLSPQHKPYSCEAKGALWRQTVMLTPFSWDLLPSKEMQVWIFLSSCSAKKKSLIFWRELEGKKKKEKESEWTSLTAFSPSLPLGKSAGTNLCSCCVELVRYSLTECFPVRKYTFAWHYLYFWKFLVFLKPYSFIFLNVQTCPVWVSPRLIVQLQTELRKLWCWAESASTCRRPITIF